jgi:hypothetical protein
MTHAKAIPDTINIHVPFRLVKRGGRKEIHLPPRKHETRQTDETLVKALARAFRWQKMLENGAYTTITELSEAEKINHSYLSRVLRLTLLAPDIVDTILNGNQSLTLKDVMCPFPLAWDQQSDLRD